MVIVAVPADIAVIKPVAETVATAALLLLQLTFLLVALAGDTVAVNCPVVPVSKERVV
jgi:hypothetical protein